MREIRFSDRIQKSFSRCWDGFKTDKDAMKARNAEAAKWVKKGYKVKKWSLAGQWRKYEGLGNPGTCVCTVYMLDVYDKW